MKVKLKYRVNFWLRQRFTSLVKRYGTEWFIATKEVERLIREKDAVIRELEVKDEQQQAYCERLEKSVGNANALVEAEALGGATYHSTIEGYKVQLNIPQGGQWPGDESLKVALDDVLQRVPDRYRELINFGEGT